MSLLLLFNQQPYFKTLLDTARRLTSEKEYAIAVVTAHMAFEVAVELAFVELFKKRTITGDLQEALLANVSDRTFQSKETRALWRALTNGDRIADADGWREYDASVKVRNKAVHTGAVVDQAQAERSLDAVLRVVQHVQRTTRAAE